MRNRIVKIVNCFIFTKLLMLFFLLILPAISLASNLSDQISAANDNFNSIQNALDELDKNIGQPLITEKAHLSDVDELLKGAEKNEKLKLDDWINRINGPGGYSALQAAHKTKNDELNARIEDYNNRCDRTSSDISYVNACNQEKAQLDEEVDAAERKGEKLNNLRNSLKQEKDGMDVYHKGLQDRRNDLNQATIDWATKVKKYNADRDALLVAYNKALAELKRLSEYNNCLKSLPKNAKIEYIKHKCGNVPFDGADPNLKPCTTEKCKEADRLFN